MHACRKHTIVEIATARPWHEPAHLASKSALISLRSYPKRGQEKDKTLTFFAKRATRNVS